MSNEDNNTSAESARAKPVYFPYREEQKAREERYPHVIGDGYRITKTGSDGNEQEKFIYEDPDILFYLIATRYHLFDRDSPERAVPHFDYYQVTDWLLKDQRTSSGTYILTEEKVEKYRKNISESLFLFNSKATRVVF